MTAAAPARSVAAAPESPPPIQEDRLKPVASEPMTEGLAEGPDFSLALASGPAHVRVAGRGRSGDDQEGDGVLLVVPHRPRQRRRDADEGPGRGRMVLAVDHDHRASLEDDEDLLLVALGLVVLGDRVALLDLDHVEAERADAEAASHELPAPVPVELAQMPDREALGHGRTIWEGQTPCRRGLSLG